MIPRRYATVLLLCLFALGGAGCTAAPTPPAPARPQAGDRVVPVIQLDEKPWRSGEAVTLVVCLQVQGPGEADARLLDVDEVPKESVPSITIVFRQGEQILETLTDVPLVRDC